MCYSKWYSLKGVLQGAVGNEATERRRNGLVRETIRHSHASTVHDNGKFATFGCVWLPFHTIGISETAR